LLAFGNKRLFVLDNDYENLKTYIPLEVDYVLLSGNPKVRNIEAINDLCHYKTLLIDGSNAYWRIKKWEKQCQDLGIDYINTAKHGALVKY
jgi:competence protein ComEC